MSSVVTPVSVSMTHGTHWMTGLDFTTINRGRLNKHTVYSILYGMLYITQLKMYVNTT